MAAIRYEFIQVGADAVENAFLSIGVAAVRTTRDVEKSFLGIVTSAQRTSRAVERELVQGLARVTDAAKKAADKEIQQITIVEQRKRRVRRSAQDEAYRDAERLAARYEREFDREARATERAAQRRASAERRANERISAERRRALGRVGADIKSGIGTAVATGTALSLGVVGGAARDELRLQETANRISINSRQAGQEYVDAATLRREFEATALATPGVKAEAVADAVQRFISLTGDMDTARRGQRVFATASSASGAAAGEVAETGASIKKNFDVESLDEMRQAIAALIYQGKAGAFELRDMAALFQRLAASGGAFGLQKGVEGVRILGGLAQLSRDATGGGEQATTAVENVFTNLKVKADDLKAQGVNVYKDGKVRDVREIIVDAIAKVGGTDIEAKNSGLSKIFGEQGIRALNPLIMRYNEVFQQTKGSRTERQEAAMAAITAQLQKAIDAPGTWADVVRDAAQAQQDSSAKVTAAFERIKAAAGDELLPAILRLEPQIPRFADALASTIPIITSFAEAAGVVVDLFDGFTTSGGDSARRASEAGMTVANLESIAKSRPLTPEEQKQLTAAKSEQTAAQREKDFIDRFVAADTSSKTLLDKQIDAKAYYDRLQKNPQDAVEYAKRVSMIPAIPFMVSGQNEAQVGIVAQEAQRVKQERQSAGAPVVQEVEQARTGLSALTEAARSAQRALEKIEASSRPSILAGQ